MLWDPGSVKKDEEEDHDHVPVTPILVPLQNKSITVEKSVPLLVPDVEELKDQFQQQQNKLTQIKETLKQNESQLSSKGKQIEDYANKLSKIRARSKNTQGKNSSVASSPAKGLTKKSSKENLEKIDSPEFPKKIPGSSPKLNRKGKVSELKKCLEENKIKFEQRTGKEQSETKKIESLVEHLKMQLEERDKTIQSLQKNIEEPSPKSELLQKKTKHKPEKEPVASKTTQTIETQPSEDSIEVITLQNKIYELETNILDLKENLKEKESVIEARTQAVTLLSQDLSLKGKNTLENLEETRQEMRSMQTNFIAIEDELRKNIEDKDNKLANLEEKYKKLESTNFELCLKNAEQQEKLVNLQTKYLEVEAERKSLSQGRSDDKLDELTKKINVLTKELDDRNKSMIKMKIEHKNKIKNMNKTLETLKGTSDEKAEILRLNNLLQEFENIKTGLENRVAELEDEKATEKKLKDQINELEMTIEKQSEDIQLHLKTISNLEKEKSDLILSAQNQNKLIESLQSKIRSMEEVSQLDPHQQESKLKELTFKIENMEAEHNRKVEDLRAEHRKEIEMMESYYNAKVDGLDRKELEEYRISTEMNNIHVEEQIELLIREKQQLLEKLKGLSGVSSTDSLTFEKMEHSDLLKDDKETPYQLGEEVDLNVMQEGENRMPHLQRIVSDQQSMINDLQKAVKEEKQKALSYQQKITELEGTIKNLEDVNISSKQQMEMVEATEPGHNQKSNVNAKNRIKKVEMELAQAKKTIQEQSEKLSELNLKMEEKEDLIKKYTEKIELFEKDDWDRQNHWQNTEDNMENMQELQKKCLSLENSLIELNEDCERLRKENIEIVHLLSEEKVKRRKLLEQLQAESKCDNEKMENKKLEEELISVKQRITYLSQIIQKLEEKFDELEFSNFQKTSEPSGADTEKSEALEIAELQEKLEWTNVVLTSKETEIFRLQNLLEDRLKSFEDLEGELTVCKTKLAEKEKTLDEIIEKLKAKEIQVEEISGNFDRLQESVDVANERTAMNESQLKELLATVKDMEGDVFKKETELQEIKGILAEKNLDMTNLKNRLEEVNSDLTYSYQEHLENMGKCLRDKESEFDALLAQKNHLEEVNRILVTEKEDIYNQKVEILNEKQKLVQTLEEKDRVIEELNKKWENVPKADAEVKSKSHEMEELKIKMKKLAANLKKKAQNETDLQKEVNDLKGFVAEKDQTVEKLQLEVNEVREKWTFEKSEKEQIQNELAIVSGDKIALENESKALKEKIVNLEKELSDSKIMYENHIRQMEAHIQTIGENSTRLQMTEQQDKDKIAFLEAKLSELSQVNQNMDSAVTELKEERKSKEALLEKLAEVSGKYEEMKFKYEQLVLEKSNLEKRLEELEKLCESLTSEKSGILAKLQENLAVIESLETDLEKTRGQVKSVEEKFFHSEERRLSLENKNEEMCKKIMEDSENLVTIDDLSNRVYELLKSEKYLQDYVKTLESGNSELKQVLEEMQTSKYNLEKELKSASEKVVELNEELKELRNSDSDKMSLTNELRKEVEKLRADYKQKSSDFVKLNQDYEQFEIDFKESLESSQNVEKSLRHRIEELTNENASLIEKCKFLEEKVSHKNKAEEEEVEDKKPKKRKSVTFRTDEVEYIKDLKNKLHDYDASLKQANEEIKNYQAELLRERLKNEVSKVLVEAQEKVESLRSTPEKHLPPVVEPQIEKLQLVSVNAQKSGDRKFDASVFFGSNAGDSFEGDLFFQQKTQEGKVKTEEPQQSSEFDSLVWDDCWGTEGHLEEEYLSTRVSETNQALGVNYEEKIKSLECEIQRLTGEHETLSKELQEQTAKYAKAIKKLKEQKAVNDKLQAELNKTQKNSSEFGDLEAAIVDELKSQIESMEGMIGELTKNLENSKLEKETLLKRIDVLNAGNEKFLEMKERQDNEAEVWERKNKELLKEISELRQKITEPQIPDDNLLMKENIELKNQVDALEWKNIELNELLEEKQEQLERGTRSSADVETVMEEKSLLQKEIDELNNVKEMLERKLRDEEQKNSMTIGELNEKLSVVVAEKETLQKVVEEMKQPSETTKKDKSKESKLFDYFKSSAVIDLFSVPTTAEMEDLLRAESKPIQKEQNEAESMEQKTFDVEDTSKSKDEELKQLQELNLVKENEVQELRQKLLDLQSEKEGEINRLKQGLSELEGRFRLKEQESLQLMQTQSSAKEKEIEILKQRISELEVSSKDQGVNMFKTVDLSQETENLFAPENEEEILRQSRINELEGLLRLREEELQRIQLNLQQENEYQAENVRQRIFQLEDMLRSKEEELNRLQSVNWNQQSGNETEVLKRKIQELEEAVKFKENEIYQVHSLKEMETQELNQKICQLENALAAREPGLLQENDGLQSQMFALENMLRYKEEELYRFQCEKSCEIESLQNKIVEFENLVSVKNQEINQVMARLQDLGKNYNDSKLEIERLLNEEKLNTEEKFVEPFQKNIQIPVSFEVEALSRNLNEEKQKLENLKYELLEKDNCLEKKDKEIQDLNARLLGMESKLKESEDEESRQRMLTSESCQVKGQLEKMVSDLQKELEASNFQLSLAKREVEEYQNLKEEAMSSLKSQLFELENELVESTDKKNSEIAELKGELNEKTKMYEKMLEEKKREEIEAKEKMSELEKAKRDLEKEVEILKTELMSKEADVTSLAQTLEEDRNQLIQLSELLEAREKEVADLTHTLTHLQEEIGQFRNFEKQVKELRVAQIKDSGAEVPVTSEGDPDLSDWSEHELAELSIRLQSDLDTALYMLHQRDVRCDELTFELMQLLEERDTLQLRLSTALRINEELRSMSNTENSSLSRSLQVDKDIVDQSNDRQAEKTRIPSEDFQKLASKISELHSVSYLRDKTVKDDSVQRHNEQMNLLSRVSDSDISFSRDTQSSPAVLLNWMRGKTTPKVMHI